MTPNGSDIPLINSDPRWATINASAARSNRPNFAEFLRGPGKYYPGREFELSSDSKFGDKLEQISIGFASKELGPVSPTVNPTDKIDFEAPAGMIASLKVKSENLPTREVFFPIVNGLGVTDRAAIDAWRTFTTAFASVAGVAGQTLDRGITR